MAEELNGILEEEKEEDFSQDSDFHDNLDLHTLDTLSDELKTHQRIRNNLSGSLIKLEKGQATVNLHTTNEMIIDDMGLIHSGFVFSAADFAAAAAVNEENLVIIGARTSFLAPTKVNDLIQFQAKAKFEDSRKREIHVVGKVNDIKVFEGTFHAVVLDKHIFKIKIKNAHRQFE